MSWPAPTRSSRKLHEEVYDWAKKISEHLKPKTRAYHEIWLDGEKLVGPPEEEPILGPLYLPRKFKTGIVVPPHNDVDVFSQDLGFIAILDNEGLEEGTLLGFNLVVGGGLGATHGEPQTYPRIADVIGFLHARADAQGGRDRGHDPARLRRPHRSQTRAPQVHHRRSRRRLVQG